jgi:hypothetical protein
MCGFNACNRCLSGVKRFKFHHWFGYFFDVGHKRAGKAAEKT